MGKAVISEILLDSIAQELGLIPGDKILKINECEPSDLIDFQYLWAGEEVNLLVEKKDGEQVIYEIDKEYDEGLGVIFEEGVFDRIRTCRNKCIFCFVDQMSPGMRPSLYNKDDDYRLSFLQGNFITLTNLSYQDKEKIKNYHLSPLYVSVHTTDPSLRKYILGNESAGNIREQLEDMISAGIRFHTQVVLCPGINDGNFLEKTIKDLGNMWPGISSLAIVPIGVTKFRRDVEKFPPFTKSYAQSLVNLVSQKQREFKDTLGYRFVFLSDEIYIQANLDFPAYDTYEDFPQLENGIGNSRLFINEFDEIKSTLPLQVDGFKDYLILTSESGQHILKPVISYLNNIIGVNLQMHVTKNDFFGSRVTVTGLLTGSDLISSMKNNVKPGQKVIISNIMLKQKEDIFLDNVKPEEVAQKLNIELIICDNSPQGLVDIILG